MVPGVVIFKYPEFWVFKNQMLFLLCCKYPNLGELKPNAFFALLVKTEKTAFIVGTDSLQYFLETPQP